MACRLVGKKCRSSKLVAAAQAVILGVYIFVLSSLLLIILLFLSVSLTKSFPTSICENAVHHSFSWRRSFGALARLALPRTKRPEPHMSIAYIFQFQSYISIASHTSQKLPTYHVPHKHIQTSLIPAAPKPSVVSSCKLNSGTHTQASNLKVKSSPKTPGLSTVCGLISVMVLLRNIVI